MSRILPPLIAGTIIDNMAKGRLSKKRKSVWFVSVRGSYLPCSWQGWLTYIPMIIFASVIIVGAVARAHSAGDVLYTVFPSLVCTAVVMHWIASRKS